MATPAATITMSMREADRLKTIQAVVDRTLLVGARCHRRLQKLNFSKSRWRATGTRRRP